MRFNYKTEGTHIWMSVQNHRHFLFVSLLFVLFYLQLIELREIISVSHVRVYACARWWWRKSNIQWNNDNNSNIITAYKCNNFIKKLRIWMPHTNYKCIVLFLLCVEHKAHQLLYKTWIALFHSIIFRFIFHSTSRSSALSLHKFHFASENSIFSAWISIV